MKRKVLAVLLAVATVFGAVGCGSEPKKAELDDGKVHLKMCWWGSQTRNDATQKVVDMYMEENPDVEIEMEFMDWSGYWDKLSTVAAGGSLPDIIQMDYGYLNQYASSNQLAELDEFMDSGVIDTSKFQEGVIESGTVDGKCYALSLGIQPPAMMYDKELVEKAGVEIPEYPTWDDIYEIGQKIYDATGVPTLFKDSSTLSCLARSEGKYFYDELKNGTATEIVDKYFALVDKFNKAEFALSPDLLAEKNINEIDTKPIIDQTTWNDYAMACQFPTMAATAGRELGMCMEPKPADATAEQNYLKPTMFFSVAETSKNKKEAAKFINWFVSDKEANLVLNAERGVPINTDVVDAVREVADANVSRLFEFTVDAGKMSAPIDPPSPSYEAEVSEIAGRLTDDVRYGDITPEEATKTFVEEATAIIAEAE